MLLLAALLFLPATVQENASVVALATIIAAIVSGGVTYLTKRSGDQATVKVSEITTRGQVEEEAYDRARRALGDIIDRQAARINELEERVEHLESRVEHAEKVAEHAESQAMSYRRTAQRLARGLHQLRVGGTQLGPDPALDEAVIETLAEDQVDD